MSYPGLWLAGLGRGTKSTANPLFGQTLPWEPRIDNGYASVVYVRPTPTRVVDI